METWQELKVTVKREGEELVSNLLIELGAQGVAIEDSMDYEMCIRDSPSSLLPL